MERLDIDVVQHRAQADALLRAVWVRGVIRTEAGFVADIAIALSLRTPEGADLWENTILASSSRQDSIRGDVWSRAFSEALTSAMSQIGPLWESRRVFAALPETRAPAASIKTPGLPALIRSDVDELPGAAPVKRAKAYAIVIGIRAYRQELPEADFADADARLFSRYLTRVLGFDEANVVTLTNEQAAKSDLEEYFESWLADRVEADSEVLVYFSGHGASDPATGEAFLVPYDGDPASLDKTGYSVKKVYAELGKLPARKVTLIMDSCFSGAGGRSVPAATPEALSERLTVLSASAGDRIGHRYHFKGHGLFTYFLLKGIKAQAGAVEISWRRAFDSAAAQVANIARREYSADQAPQWRGPGR